MRWGLNQPNRRVALGEIHRFLFRERVELLALVQARDDLLSDGSVATRMLTRVVFQPGHVGDLRLVFRAQLCSVGLRSFR